MNKSIRITPKSYEEWDFPIDHGNGMLLGPTGCHCDENTKSNQMYYGQLGLCGCGDPEAVHAMLIICAEQFDRGENNLSHFNGVDGIKKIVIENIDVVSEFIAHFLDQKDIIEHGGSVYGSWLTGRGRQFIQLGPMNDDS
jgi:hypothetical protein